MLTYIPKCWDDATFTSIEQGKSEGFDSYDRPSYLTQTEFNRQFKSSILQPALPWNLINDLEKQ